MKKKIERGLERELADDGLFCSGYGKRETARRRIEKGIEAWMIFLVA
jgi:hypothetical protein